MPSYFRSDTRPPEEIFRTGFKPRQTTADYLFYTHASGYSSLEEVKEDKYLEEKKKELIAQEIIKERNEIDKTWWVHAASANANEVKTASDALTSLCICLSTKFESSALFPHDQNQDEDEKSTYIYAIALPEPAQIDLAEYLSKEKINKNVPRYSLSPTKDVYLDVQPGKTPADINKIVVDMHVWQATQAGMITRAWRKEGRFDRDAELAAGWALYAYEAIAKEVPPENIVAAVKVTLGKRKKDLKSITASASIHRDFVIVDDPVMNPHFKMWQELSVVNSLSENFSVVVPVSYEAEVKRILEHFAKKNTSLMTPDMYFGAGGKILATPLEPSASLVPSESLTEEKKTTPTTVTATTSISDCDLESIKKYINNLFNAVMRYRVPTFFTSILESIHIHLRSIAQDTPENIKRLLDTTYSNSEDTLLTMAAIYSPSPSIPEVLLLAGASINQFRPLDGNSPLMIAVQMKKTDLLDFLISRGANVNHQNFEGDTALHIAIRNADMTTINHLLKAGADIRIQNKSGKFAFLEYSSLISNTKFIVFFLPYIQAMDWEQDDLIKMAKHFPIWLRHSYTEPEIYKTVLQKFLQILKELKWDEIKKKNEILTSLLKEALENSAPPRIVEWLLNAGAAVNSTLFSNAVWRYTKEKQDVFEILLEHTPTIVLHEQKSPDALPPIALAIILNQMSLIRRLLKAGLNVGEPFYYSPLDVKLTPFLYLIYSNGNNLDLVKKLAEPFLEEKKEEKFSSSFFSSQTRELTVNQVTSKGDTALMLAARSNNIALIQFLLLNKADPCRKNIVGETALSIAIKNDGKDAIEILEKAMDDYQKRGVSPPTPPR